MRIFIYLTVVFLAGLIRAEEPSIKVKLWREKVLEYCAKTIVLDMHGNLRGTTMKSPMRYFYFTSVYGIQNIEKDAPRLIGEARVSLPRTDPTQQNQSQIFDIECKSILNSLIEKIKMSSDVDKIWAQLPQVIDAQRVFDDQILIQPNAADLVIMCPEPIQESELYKKTLDARKLQEEEIKAFRDAVAKYGPVEGRRQYDAERAKRFKIDGTKSDSEVKRPPEAPVIIPSESKAENTTAPKTLLKVPTVSARFTLKDGRKIYSTTAADAGRSVMITQSDGSMISVVKTDILGIEVKREDGEFQPFEQ